MLKLYGHPFSSYTWKALIPLYANGTAFEFRLVGGADPEDDAFVAAASPLGRSRCWSMAMSPCLRRPAWSNISTSTTPARVKNRPLLPADPDAALEMRMLDRVFDISVMDAMQEIVLEYIRSPGKPRSARRRAGPRQAAARLRMDRCLAGYAIRSAAPSP